MTLMKTIILLILSISFFQSDAFAIDGKPMSIEQLVRLGIVQTFSSRGVFCTGTLIRPNVVLTAAHCVAMSDYVLFNTSNVADNFAKSPGVKRINVRKGIAHPKFKATYDDFSNSSN